MQLRNTNDSYGLITKTFHWVIAIAIIVMIPFGWYMEGLEPTPDKFKLYALHKSVGVLILAFVIMRFFWRMMNEQVLSNENHAKWEKALSGIVHFILYALMILMPLSGWLMSSAAGFPVSVFGYITLPDLIDKNPELGKLLNQSHSVMAWSILGIVALHALGALKHHFIDKDKTLRRMLPMIVLGLTLIPLSLNAQTLPKWEIINDKSQIEFIAKWDSSDVKGAFDSIEGEIYFDESNLDNSKAEIVIDMSSFDTGYPARDEEIAGPLWFDLDQYKQAHFITNEIVKTDGGYVVTGMLEIKGIKQQVSFPFTLKDLDGGNKRMEADFQLMRLDFDIGQEGWKSTDVIANSVSVKIDLAVRRFNPV